MFVRGRERAAQLLLAQSVLAAYGSAAVVLVVTLFLPYDFGSPAKLITLGLVHGLSQQLFVVATVESRSRGEPLRFAVQSVTRSLFIVGAGLAVAAATGSAASVIAAEAAVTLLLAHRLLWRTVAHTGLRVPGLFRLATRHLRNLDWSAAFVMLLVSLLGFAVISADRWAAASLLDTHAFANYAFGGTVLTIGLALQGVVNASVFPMLARLYARSGQAACYRLCARLSLAALAASLALALPAYYLLAAAIRRWYPVYADAVGLLPVFLFVACFRVSDFWSSYAMIAGHHRQLLWTNLAAGAAGALLWALLVRPWSAFAITPQELALLAAALCISGYAAVMFVSWRSTRWEAPA
jgi:O-antigen/teichoic acid export membrane protein